MTAPDCAEACQYHVTPAEETTARPWTPLSPEAQHAALQRLRLYAEERVALARAELARAERDLVLYEAVVGPRQSGDTERTPAEAKTDEPEQLHTPADPADAEQGCPRMPDRVAGGNAQDREAYSSGVIDAVLAYLSERPGEWCVASDMCRAMGGGNSRAVGHVLSNAFADGRLPGIERRSNGHATEWRMPSGSERCSAGHRGSAPSHADIVHLAEIARTVSRGIHPRHGFPGAQGDALRRLAAAALHASPPPAGAGYSARGLLDTSADLGWIPAEQVGPLEQAIRSALANGADGVRVLDAAGTTAYRPA